MRFVLAMCSWELGYRCHLFAHRECGFQAVKDFVDFSTDGLVTLSDFAADSGAQLPYLLCGLRELDMWRSG